MNTFTKKTIVLLSAILLTAALPARLSAEALKKLLILDFINVEKNSNYQYLANSITTAVKKMLKERFAFKEADKTQWDPVAVDNYLYTEDFYTKSVGMNLGLLSKQDIVIAGGYTIRDTKLYKPAILTNVRILDIAKKEVIANFTVEGPADNRVFDSVEKLAERVADESKKVLPSKEDWKKKGLVDEGESAPWFTNPAFGIRGGGGLYRSGYADRIEAKLPAISFLIQFKVPVIWQRLAVEAEMTYMRHQPIEGENPNIEGLKATTTNYIAGGFIVLDLSLTRSIGLHPKIGGGYVMQSTEVTGERNKNFDNGFTFAGGGLDISYMINRNLSVILNVQNYTEFEQGTITLLNMARLGVNVKF